MGWMCEPTQEAYVVDVARCGTCGWRQEAKDRLEAQRLADEHREAHERLWESSGNTDLGEHLNATDRAVRGGA